MGDRIRKSDCSGVRYYALEFSELVTVAAAFGWHPTHNFRDQELQCHGSEPPSDLLLWSALPTQRGGVCVYVWLGQQPRSVEFIQGLHRVPEAKLSDAMVRFSSLCENTYFEPGWWDALHSVKKRLLRERLRATIDPDPIII